MGHVGLVVFHAREALHQRSVLGQLLLRAKHQLVHRLPGVGQGEPQRFALGNLDAVWREAHVVAHLDRDGAFDRPGLPGNAPGFLLQLHRPSLFDVGFVAVRERRRCTQQQERQKKG